MPVWESIEERFWSKVDKNGPIPEHVPHLGQCWVWTATTVNGYGQFRDGIRMERAHRWVMGKPKRLIVLHKCDNPACVRPDHLAIGTMKDNMMDAKAKGRMSHVGGRGKRRFTDEQVREMRALTKTKTYREIAKLFNAPLATTAYAITGKERYRDVE